MILETIILRHRALFIFVCSFSAKILMHYISTITTKIMKTMGKPMAIKKAFYKSKCLTYNRFPLWLTDLGIE